jgi:signal transduction histidine kinase
VTSAQFTDDALHAMDGRGTLHVSTRLECGAVLVEIGDTGAGMTPETKDHAFDPFHPTKGVGEGTGLVPDISRRVVDRHRGDISIETRPGETVLRVRLPATGADTHRRQPVGTVGRVAGTASPRAGPW